MLLLYYFKKKHIVKSSQMTIVQLRLLDVIHNECSKEDQDGSNPLLSSNKTTKINNIHNIKPTNSFEKNNNNHLFDKTNKRIIHKLSNVCNL